MTLPTLHIAPLTVAAFAPFGEVIDSQDRESFLINQGTTERFHALAQVQLMTDPAAAHSDTPHAILSIFRAQPRVLPLTISLLEKHPLGSQAFVPLSSQPYLVVVATGTDIPEGIQAFYAEPHQGVNYHAGIWHHPLIALHQVSDFLVVDRLGSGINCIEQLLTQPLQLTLPQA